MDEPHERVVPLRVEGDLDPGRDLGSVTFSWAMVCEALKRYAETGDPDPALR